MHIQFFACLMLVGLVACQSEQDGMQALCDAPSTCTECAATAPDMRARVLADHIEGIISNSDVAELFDSLSNAAPAARIQIVRERAAAVGITECAIVDVWEMPEPTLPETEPSPLAPALETLPAPSRGQAQIALPTPDGHWTFAAQTLEAGFGKDDDIWLIQFKPLDEADESISMQLTFHGAGLGAGTHRILRERDGITHVFSIALGRTQLRTTGGEIVLERVSDEDIVGTVDLEVRHPMTSEATQLRGRFHARYDSYYDAALDHARAIRQRLEQR